MSHPKGQGRVREETGGSRAACAGREKELRLCPTEGAPLRAWRGRLNVKTKKGWGVAQGQSNLGSVPSPQNEEKLS